SRGAALVMSDAGPRAPPMPVVSPLLHPFAPRPTTPEAIIVQVRAQLAADAAGGPALQAADLDQIAETAVRQLWGGRVTVFVPILALRAAREALCALGPGAKSPRRTYRAWSRHQRRSRGHRCAGDGAARSSALILA
ncbi:MAG: three-helix bundle dimerization domain-containing protein, partial [Thermomicrobiales bacterium]